MNSDSAATKYLYRIEKLVGPDHWFPWSGAIFDPDYAKEQIEALRENGGEFRLVRCAVLGPEVVQGV